MRVAISADIGGAGSPVHEIMRDPVGVEAFDVRLVVRSALHGAARLALDGVVPAVKVDHVFTSSLRVQRVNILRNNAPHEARLLERSQVQVR
jgi:hypothetical protein